MQVRKTIKPRIVGITGASGSGKTTLVKALTNRFPHIPHFSTDDFFKELSDYNRHPDGSIDFDHPDNILWEELAENIAELMEGRPANIPIYKKGINGGRLSYRTINPSSTIIVEGYLLFTNRSVLDYILPKHRVFLDLPFEERKQRRLKAYSDMGLDTLLDMDGVENVFREYVLPTKNECEIILDATLKPEDLVELTIHKLAL